jgi:hypothetical protein
VLPNRKPNKAKARRAKILEFWQCDTVAQMLLRILYLAAASRMGEVPDRWAHQCKRLSWAPCFSTGMNEVKGRSGMSAAQLTLANVHPTNCRLGSLAAAPHFPEIPPGSSRYLMVGAQHLHAVHWSLFGVCLGLHPPLHMTHHNPLLPYGRRGLDMATRMMMKRKTKRREMVMARRLRVQLPSGRGAQPPALQAQPILLHALAVLCVIFWTHCRRRGLLGRRAGPQVPWTC